ncbi:MAG TPA: TolC family protein [Candidatus Acidoferrum sp.]|jgi:outer membrane protein TolC
MPLIRTRARFPIRVSIFAAIALLSAYAGCAQQSPTQAQSGTAPVRLTLHDALNRARAIDVVYQATLTQAGLAHQDKKQALDALLPTVTYNNSAIYTQGGGVNGNPVRFIANNAVHEYISQGDVHEALDVAAISDLRRASATAAAARARVEIASRGLVVTVMQNYFATLAAQQKLESSQRASDEGDRFFKITQDLEHGGEVAHSDVIKAELQANDRRRQLQEARLAVINTRLDLSVLIFLDFNDNFELADDLHAAVPLPTLPEVQQRAAQDNPDIRAALETVKEAGHGVTASRAAYLPSLSIDYFYGIDASHFATKTDGISNLGSSIIASVNIPIWNWGATQSRVKQAELVRDQAKRELSLSQRKLLAELQSLYAEADTAASELTSLSRSTDLAKESLRLTTLRYKDGEATVLEVVDAQTTTATADAAFQDGAVRYRVALANLQTLTGTLTTP